VKVLELEPGRGGCFEVFVDGKRIYSKLETGAFPEPHAVLNEVTALAG
jgi:selenoprotein W-related protein